MSSHTPLTPAAPVPTPRWWPRLALLIGLVGCVTAAALLAVGHRRDADRREREALDAARAQAAEAAGEIDRAFREARAAADAVVRDLSAGTLPYTDLEKRMRAELAARPALDGIAITFEPFAHDPNQRLYQEYVSRQADGTVGVLKGASYDYTALPSPDPGGPKTAWYHTPRTAGPTWNEPFLATGAGKVLIEYGAPFDRRGEPGRVAGVVTVDYALRDVRDLLARLDLGATGYGVVFTTRGTYLAHPDRRQVVAGSALGAEPGGFAGPARDAAREAARGTAAWADYRDPVSGQDGWVLFEPIPSTGWVLGVVRWKAEAAAPPAERLRRWTVVALAGGGAVVFLAAFLAGLGRGSPHAHAPAAVAVVVSLTCAALVVLTWWLARDVRGDEQTGSVTGPAAAGRYLEVYRRSLRRDEPVHVVPTGVYLTAVRFPDPGTVTVGGYVWQRYPAGTPKEVARGVRFPQQIDEPVIVEQVQRATEAGDEVIVWSVTVTLQQSFDPALFPFDHRRVAVRLEPAELAANVVLVPDFAAYPLTAPRARPGLSPEVRVSNWHFRESSFGFRPEPPGPTLGLPARAERGEVPVLYLTIEARRNFVGPFIAYLTPALVAAGLAFAVLLSVREVDGWAELVTGLSYVAALFFVLVVGHASLRDTVSAVGITYLEHVYIVLYCAVALVVVNLFLLARRPLPWVVRYRDNLVPKLLYWPAFTGTVLACTLLAFVWG